MYTRSYGSIHAYGSRRAGPDAADEIAAETFLVAWRRFDAIPAAPLPWLYGVARKIVMRDYQSRRRQQRVRDALTHERSEPWPDREDSESIAIQNAWAQLRPADREVMALGAWEELSVAEAAHALGCSPAVFSVRLHRARRRVERLLAAGSVPAPSTELSEA